MNATMAQAINQALALEMERDGRVVILGEDVGIDGGVFRITDGLVDKFGRERVIDTPLAESAGVGVAIGMAALGLRPVVEIQFMGFIYPAFNQIVSHVARLRNRTRGRFTVPIVIRTPYGAGVRALEHHSESTEALFCHIPGLTVVVPSTPYDAKGLLVAAIRGEDPVIFLEPTRLYRAEKQDVPDEAYEVPIGKARIVAGRERPDHHRLGSDGPGRGAGGRPGGGERLERRGHRPEDLVSDGPGNDRRVGEKDRPGAHRP